MSSRNTPEQGCLPDTPALTRLNMNTNLKLPKGTPALPFYTMMAEILEKKAEKLLKELTATGTPVLIMSWSHMSKAVELGARVEVLGRLGIFFRQAADPKNEITHSALQEMVDRHVSSVVGEALSTSTSDASNLINKALAKAWMDAFRWGDYEAAHSEAVFRTTDK